MPFEETRNLLGASICADSGGPKNSLFSPCRFTIPIAGSPAANSDASVTHRSEGRDRREGAWKFRSWAAPAVSPANYRICAGSRLEAPGRIEKAAIRGPGNRVQAKPIQAGCVRQTYRREVGPRQHIHLDSVEKT